MVGINNFEIKRDTFYKTENLFSRLDEFLEDCKKLSYNLYVEQKYVEGRWREPSDKSLEFIVGNIKEDEDLRFLIREPIIKSDKRHLEAVFKYSPEEWYLATFEIEDKYENFFVKKYDLKPLM